MTDSGSKDAAEFKPTDLDPEELSKAIEKSVAVGRAKAAKKSARAKTPEAEKKKVAVKHDAGVRIEVKKHKSAYVAKDSSKRSAGLVDTPTGTGSSSAAKTVRDEGLPKDGGQAVPNNAAKAPSRSGKTIKPENSALKDTAEPPAKPNSEPSAVRKVSAARADAGASLSSEQKPDSSNGGDAKTVKTQLSERNKVQDPKVFDTNKYHLPIKPRSRHYVSDSIAWSILTLFLLAVTAYMLIQLEIVDPTQFGL